MRKQLLPFLLTGAGTVFCGIVPAAGAAAQTVEPMVSAQFDQSAPYNNACPEGCVTGCGPTAVAQILKYYGAPGHGFGQAPLSYNGETISVDMEALWFDWANILDKYSGGSYSTAEADAVARLMYACGVAMNVKYGSATSVTNYARMIYGLQHYLHISPDSRYLHRKNFSTSEWIEILDGQLRGGRPVFYRGTWFFNDQRADHMFVIDGMDGEGKYHVNWGHSGRNDKFAGINVLNQSGSFPGGRGVCYNASQAMLTDLYPTPEFNDYPVQACVSEEPPVLNGDITLRSVTLPLGTDFTLSCRLRNVSEQKATITYGWALVKEGEFVEMLSRRNYGLSPGYTFTEARHLTVNLPKSLSDGDYSLRLYSRSDLDGNWREVWRDAATEASVTVSGGVATVTVPDNHLLNPDMYLGTGITEVANEFENVVPGRAFELKIINPTTNNFENTLLLDILTDDGAYSYSTTIPVYGQTSETFHILVPYSHCALRGRNISSVTASYYYEPEDRYIALTTTPVGVSDNPAEPEEGTLAVYDLNGMKVIELSGSGISSAYREALDALPRGVYIVREGTHTRKIVK